MASKGRKGVGVVDMSPRRGADGVGLWWWMGKKRWEYSKLVHLSGSYGRNIEGNMVETYNGIGGWFMVFGDGLNQCNYQG